MIHTLNMISINMEKWKQEVFYLKLNSAGAGHGGTHL
jgi:hypothetical protein